MLDVLYSYLFATILISTDLILLTGTAVHEPNQVWGVIESYNKCAGKFLCKNGACFERQYVCDKVIHCLDGSDEDESMCESLKQAAPVKTTVEKVISCEPLISTDIAISCMFNGKDVPCYEEVRPGTLADMSCKLKDHALAATTLYHNYCQENGQWLYELPNCQPLGCRIHSNEVVISNNAAQNDDHHHNAYPWNVMIYKIDGNNTLNFTGVMGSLLNEYTIVTDALGRLGPGLDIFTLNTSTIKIVVGQQYRDLEDPRNTDLQYINVIYVHTFSVYLPSKSRICLLELETPVQFTTHISPICLSVERDLSIERVYGMTYGWDSTKTRDVMLEQTVKYMKRLDCYDYIRKIDNNAFSKHEKDEEEFCGVTHLLRGEQKRNLQNFGTAFTYILDERQYLYGVAKSTLRVKLNESKFDDIYVFNDVQNQFVYDYINSTANNIKGRFERSCKPILSTNSMAVECEYMKKPISCRVKMPVGSLAKTRCVDGYTPTIQSALHFENYCKNDGSWLYPILECNHDCGVIDESLRSTEANGANEVFSPWLANIYKWGKRDSHYVFVCTGVLVSPFSILTLAACSDPSGPVNKTTLKIAVAKNHILYQDPRDANAQYFDIEEIYFDNSTGLAVLELSNIVNVNKYTMPVCIDFNNQFRLTKSSIANVIYWDYRYEKKDSIDLLNSTVTYIESNDECKSMLLVSDIVPDALNDDLFCADYVSNTSDNANILSGSGLVDRAASVTSQFGGKHYLFGIQQDQYVVDKKTVQVLFNITAKHTLDFLKTSLIDIRQKRSIPIDKCVVPTSYGTKFSRSPCTHYRLCPEILSGEFVDQFSLIHINCMDGFVLADDGYSYTTCNKGKWQPERNTCVRLCEPIASKSTWTQCIYNGREVRCDQKMRPGTFVTSECSTGYESTEQIEFYNNTCLENGEWLRSLQQCNHTCGIINGPTPTIQGGHVAKKAQHPWNAAIYLRNESSTIHICGGTLITPTCVLTAAHCVHHPKTRVKFPTDAIVVGFGKEHRTLHHPSDVHAEFKGVRFVHVPSFYDGRSINFLFDIAILEVDSPVKLGNNILPACIDSSHEFKLALGAKGIVVGWGYDNDRRNQGKPTEILHKAELPYLSLEECSKWLPAKSKGAITKDKFCAFYANRNITTRVRSGDSGAGLIFELDDRYYVMGLVSTSVLDTISTFTDISVPLHLDFITRTVQNATRRTYNSRSPAISQIYCYSTPKA